MRPEPKRHRQSGRYTPLYHYDQQLRHDPAFQVAAGRTPAQNNYEEDHSPLASPSTHSRFENRIDSKTIFRLHEVLVDTFLESFDEPPEEIILDYDATDDLIHGKQEGRHFNGFYDGYCYLPLYVFCGDQLLVSYLRPSSVGAAHHARPVTKLLVQKIRAHWPGVRIILRGDSGFATERLMRWCDKNDVGYVFGLQKNNFLIRNIACEMTRARIQQSHLGAKQACFKWFRYRAQRTWDRHRWVIGKAETAFGRTQQMYDTTMGWRFINEKLQQQYGTDVITLPKQLDEKVGRLHLDSLGVKLTELSQEQADYIDVPVEGPFKPDYYRY